MVVRGGHFTRFESPRIYPQDTYTRPDDRDNVYQDAVMLNEGAQIAAIGPTPELLAQYPEAERVNGREKAVMPGFARTHTHLFMTLARGIYENFSPPHTPPLKDG